MYQKWQTLSRYQQVMCLVFIVGVVGSASSFFGQYVLKLNPCVMCIQQRVAMMLMTLMTAIMLLLPLKKMWARTCSALCVSLFAGFGAYIAAKQLHLQSLPLMEQPSCGAPWTFRLRGAPLFDWYEPIIRGTGVCGEIHRILGISLPMWSLLFFVAVLMMLWGTYFYSHLKHK